MEVTILLILAVITLCFWRRYCSPLRDVPGPFLASLTRLWHIASILRGHQNLNLIRLHDENGHFVRIAPNEVSVSHPDAPKAVLLSSLRKGDWYEIFHFPDKRFKNAMGATDPATKNELSRHVAAGYTLSNMLRSEPEINSIIKLLMDWLDRHAEERKPIDLDKFFTYATLDIVGETVFSKSFGFLREGKDIGGAIRNTAYQNVYATVGGHMQWFHILLSNPFITWLNVLPFGHIIDTAMGAIKERAKNPDARMDVVHHWFKYLEEHPDRMIPEEIQSAATNTVAAGADTVACGLQTFVYYMIRQPELWERTAREVNKMSPETNGIIVSYEDTQRMPLLRACIKECLRLVGPAAMGLPRVAGKGGLTIGDRTFPEGTTVSVSLWVIHHSKEIWGPDAREFRPERWLEGEKSTALEKYYIPFGMGYMTCPGQHLARIELHKICATVVRDYQIRQVNPGQEWKWDAYFGLFPHSWPCYVAKRQKTP